MSRPWFGILPPPEGQGYDTTWPPRYRPEPSAFEPVGRQKRPHLFIGDEGTDIGREAIDRAIRAAMDYITSEAEAATRSIVVEHLRSLGYKIEEPS